MQTQELTRTEPRVTTKPAAPKRQAVVVTPRLDVYESETAYGLTFEMPGVDESAIDVTVEKNVLTVSATLPDPSYEGYELRYAEYNPTHYRRTLELGDTIDASAITAQLRNGLLHVTLPKRAEAQPRKIEVKLA